MKEALFSSCESWIVAALNLPEKYSGLVFSLLQQQFWSIIWVVWNKQAACHLLLESHLTVQSYLIKVTTSMAVSTLRTLSLDMFSHGMVQDFLGVSLQSSKNVGQHVLMNLGIGVWWQKKHMSIVEAWELQIWTCQKNMLVHFSLYCQHLLDHRKSKGIPLAWRGNPLQYSCLENPMDGRS